MNKCGTCIWWTPPDKSQKGWEDGWDEVGCCELITGPQDREELEPRGKFLNDWRAAVVDGSDYFAALRCRDTFGCVLLEGK